MTFQLKINEFFYLNHSSEQISCNWSPLRPRVSKLIDNACAAAFIPSGQIISTVFKLSSYLQLKNYLMNHFFYTFSNWKERRKYFCSFVPNDNVFLVLGMHTILVQCAICQDRVYHHLSISLSAYFIMCLLSCFVCLLEAAEYECGKEVGMKRRARKITNKLLCLHQFVELAFACLQSSEHQLSARLWLYFESKFEQFFIYLIKFKNQFKELSSKVCNELQPISSKHINLSYIFFYNHIKWPQKIHF